MTPDRRDLVPDSDIRNWVGPFQDKEFYYTLGRSQAAKLREWLAIGPDSRLLDLGCGCGRLAIHFLDVLSPRGTYRGLDCNPELLGFCTRTLEPLRPGFRFDRLDVFNGSYGERGSRAPTEAVFPLGDASVDAVIVWSVFTHMRWEDTAAYLAEAGRVLAPGGRMALVLNLHNPAVAEAVARGKAQPAVRHPWGPCSWVMDPARPEDCFAHDEAALLGLLGSLGLEVLKLEYGRWALGGPEAEFHDVVVVGKR